jgi:hypothetical protein
MATEIKGVIYGITLNGDLMWMRHDGRNDGSFRWEPMPNGGKKVGHKRMTALRSASKLLNRVWRGVVAEVQKPSASQSTSS